jgi:arginase family enzyme
MPPRNFLGIPAENSKLATSPYVILPVPYEETATYGKGTQYAPAAIIAASQEVELFDDELGREPYLAGIHPARRHKTRSSTRVVVSWCNRARLWVCSAASTRLALAPCAPA